MSNLFLLSSDYTKSDIVVIMGGTNNLPGCKSYEGILKFEKCLSNISKLSKITNVLVCSLPPRFDCPQLNLLVKQLNNKITQMSNVKKYFFTRV